MKQARFFSAVLAGLFIFCSQVNAEPIGARYFGQVVANEYDNSNISCIK